MAILWPNCTSAFCSSLNFGPSKKFAAGISGFSQYDKLYADVELWLAQGWMDYLVPQLYWQRAASGQGFGTLLPYWRGGVTTRVIAGGHIAVGQEVRIEE